MNLLNEELIDFLLTYKKFKVLSISIDNKKIQLGKMLTLVKKMDEKMGKSGKNDALFSKRKRELGHDSCVLDAKTVVLDDNASELLEIHKYCV